MIPTGQSEPLAYVTRQLSQWYGQSAAQSCTRCGALVIDTDLHTAWHEET